MVEYGLIAVWLIITLLMLVYLILMKSSLNKLISISLIVLGGTVLYRVLLHLLNIENDLSLLTVTLRTGAMIASFFQFDLLRRIINKNR